MSAAAPTLSSNASSTEPTTYPRVKRVLDMIKVEYELAYTQSELAMHTGPIHAFGALSQIIMLAAHYTEKDIAREKKREARLQKRLASLCNCLFPEGSSADGDFNRLVYYCVYKTSLYPKELEDYMPLFPVERFDPLEHAVERRDLHGVKLLLEFVRGPISPSAPTLLRTAHREFCADLDEILRKTSLQVYKDRNMEIFHYLFAQNAINETIILSQPRNPDDEVRGQMVTCINERNARDEEEAVPQLIMID